MERSLRFFWMASRYHMMGFIAITAGLLGIYFALPALAMVVTSWSAVLGICALLAGLTNDASDINLPISMGETRKNYFLAIQCNILLHAVLITLLNRGVDVATGGHYIWDFPLWMGVLGYGTVYLFATVTVMVMRVQDLAETIVFVVGLVAVLLICGGYIENWDGTAGWESIAFPFVVLTGVIIISCQCYLWNTTMHYCVK